MDKNPNTEELLAALKWAVTEIAGDLTADQLRYATAGEDLVEGIAKARKAIASAEQAHAAKDSPTLQDEGVRAALKSVIVYQVEEDEGRVHLGIDGQLIVSVSANSAKGVALLQFDAEQRAALARGEAQASEFEPETPSTQGKSSQNASIPLDHHHEAGGAPGREVWRRADQTPTVAAGRDAYFIVAVRRAHNGKVFSFPATYLNSMVLDFEDEGETRPTTGWFSATADEDDHRSYHPLLSSQGDELVAWCEVPQFAPETTPPSDQQGREQVIGELCEAVADVVRAVEGPGAPRWVAGPLRLKDRNEWARLYVAFNKLAALKARSAAQ